jgi:hypothetical protein
LAAITPAPRFSPQAAIRSLPDTQEVAFLPLHIVLTGLVVVAGLTTIALRVYEFPARHTPIAVATGATVIGLIAYARYFLHRPWISASVVYLMLFWMFHFGMTFTAAVFPSVLAPLPDEDIEWFYWPNVRMSMILGVLGAVGFVFGVGLVADRRATEPVQTTDRVHDAGLYLIGWPMMLVGIAASAAVLVQNGGLAVFSLSYLEVLNLGGSTNFGNFIDLSQLGCMFALCGAGGRRWIFPFVVWLIFAGVPMLLLGLRTDAIVPLVSYAIVLTHRGVRFRPSLLIAVVLALLIVIPGVYAFRLVGFANRQLVSWTQVTPLDTFMELGGSLRATKAYVDWIEQGDSYLLGASYWAPFDRQILVRVLPSREPIPYAEDERVPLRLMDGREGAVGGSATGEAYYNFGVVGPFIYFAGLGLVLGWLERSAGRSAYGCAILGSILLPLCFNIRGDWLALPAQIGQALALVVFCYIVDRLVWSRATNKREVT